MPKKIQLMFEAISNIVFGIIIILVVALVGGRAAGYQIYTILSGSMEPTYPTGSVIYVKEIHVKKLDVGDPISYTVSEDTVVTHRITEVIPDENNGEIVFFRTKGDANKAADGELVRSENIVGKPVFSIPVLGFALYYLKTPPASYLIIAISLFLILISILPEIFGKKT